MFGSIAYYTIGLGSLVLCQEVVAQVPIHEAQGFGTTTQGHYFITTLSFLGNSNAQARAVIMDGRGDVVFHQRVPNVSNFRVWPDGRMSYAARGKHILLDSDFELLDSVSCVNGITNDLHELQILSNGHYLLLGTESITMDLSDHSFFINGNATGSATASVKSAVIQELDADKNLVWEWHAVDHFDFLDVDTTRLNNPNTVDWTHSNAVEMDADGNVLLSSRHFNEITKIDRNTGEIMWRLGGVQNEFDFGSDPGFFLQHDIRRLPNGNITLFDNSKANEHPGRGVEYMLDEVAHTATAVWSSAYGPSTYSRAMGSMQRLSNGNTLIGWGALTPENVMFTTYGPDGSWVNELNFMDTLITYRAYFFDDVPFTINRPEISCVSDGSTYVLTASPVGTSYLWSNGETSQSITVGANDTVHVEIPIGSGGFLRSSPFVPYAECSGTGVNDGEIGPTLLIYPNPASSVLNVRTILAHGPQEIELSDTMGKTLRVTSTTSSSEQHIDVSELTNGLYFLRIDGIAHRFVKSEQ